MKINLIKLSRAANDNPVVAKQEAAERGNDCDTPYINCSLNRDR